MKGKRMLKIFSNMVTGLLFILLLVTLFAVISMKASGGEANLFGYQMKTVLSGSMEPEMKTGSIIAIKATDVQEEFQKGDVITFKTEDDVFVTHRIEQVKDNGKHYITKGDANNAPDSEPVVPEDIVGMYTGFTVPYVGYVMNFASSKEGAALMLIIPGVCLLLFSILMIWRALRQLDKVKGGMRADVE